MTQTVSDGQQEARRATRTSDRCQVCGRIIGLRSDGTLRLHHYRSNECYGSHRLPYMEACDGIQEAALFWYQRELACEREFKAHREQRRNVPLSADFWVLYGMASRERSRLQRRFLRWLRRFDRRLAEAA
jgi:hypothetical protein